MFGTGGLATFLNDNVIQLLLILVAIAALWASRKGEVSKVVTVGICLVLGLAILALSANGGALGKELGAWVVELFRVQA